MVARVEMHQPISMNDTIRIFFVGERVDADQVQGTENRERAWNVVIVDTRIFLYFGIRNESHVPFVVAPRSEQEVQLHCFKFGG